MVKQKSKKIKKIFFIFIIFFLLSNFTSNANEEIISSQIDSLNLNSVLNDGEKYLDDYFSNIDLNNLLKSAIKGDINNKYIYKGIINIFVKELVNTFSVLGSILIIIVIHSLLKGIIDNLGKENSVGKIAYYTQYILIVAIIMSNFSDLIRIIKDQIENLVSFVNLLFPILIALMSATGNIAPITLIEPLIFFSIIFIANIITYFIIPITLVATAIAIVSNISDKIEILKLSKFLKSSITWILGIIITVFVSVISLEGELTSNVDGIAAKGIKAATTTFVPIVGKVLGESTDMVIRSDIYIKKCSRYCRNNCNYWDLLVSNNKTRSINFNV